MLGVFCSTYVLLICHFLLRNKHFSLAGTVQHEFRHLHWNGYKLRSDLVDVEITTRSSLIQCTSECVQRGNYRTISWNAQEKICLLGITDVTHERYAEIRLEVDSEWTTLSRIEYTGLLVLIWGGEFNDVLNI